uniref:Uncharacterized protein n=1 Tax=Rhizophora mucronata TaxID=61149 RepID=A0A2P2R4B6_RHIMU
MILFYNKHLESQHKPGKQSIQYKPCTKLKLNKPKNTCI